MAAGPALAPGPEAWPNPVAAGAAVVEADAIAGVAVPATVVDPALSEGGASAATAGAAAADIEAAPIPGPGAMIWGVDWPGDLKTATPSPPPGSSILYPSGRKVLNPRTSFLFPWKRFETRRMTPGVSICWVLKVFIISKNSL